MAYYLDLFSPETYEAFSKSTREVSGFRARQEGMASRIKAGDKLICYMTKLGRWVGVLELTGNYFKDEAPIFYSANDPFIIRFKVKPLVWLPKEKAIPIRDERIWNKLSFTKGVDKNASQYMHGEKRCSRRYSDRFSPCLKKGRCQSDVHFSHMIA